MIARLLMFGALTAATLSSGAQAFAAPTLDRVLAATDWLNGKPSHADVRGKVVLLDFYTFECINCKHVEPNLRRLAATQVGKDFAIISVHSPETIYERSRDNLSASLKDQGVTWPVAVDDDFAIWNSYGVSAWPTQMIFDRHGILRQTIVGEGQDDVVDQTIAQLIAQR